MAPMRLARSLFPGLKRVMFVALFGAADINNLMSVVFVKTRTGW